MTGPVHAIRLSELPASEARVIFNGYVAGQPERLAAFVAEVRRRGGPAELDYSLESLDPLWSWFIAEHRPRRWFAGPHRVPLSPVPDAVMRSADPPWWYEMHPPSGRSWVRISHAWSPAWPTTSWRARCTLGPRPAGCLRGRPRTSGNRCSRSRAAAK